MFFSLVYVWDGRRHPFTWRAPGEQDASDTKQKRGFWSEGDNVQERQRAKCSNQLQQCKGISEEDQQFSV